MPPPSATTAATPGDDHHLSMVGRSDDEGASWVAGEVDPIDRLVGEVVDADREQHEHGDHDQRSSQQPRIVGLSRCCHPDHGEHREEDDDCRTGEHKRDAGHAYHLLLPNSFRATMKITAHVRTANPTMPSNTATTIPTVDHGRLRGFIGGGLPGGSVRPSDGSVTGCTVWTSASGNIPRIDELGGKRVPSRVPGWIATRDDPSRLSRERWDQRRGPRTVRFVLGIRQL